MKTRYLLLNPLDHDDFACTLDEMIEALHEFGIGHTTSLNTRGESLIYAVSHSKTALENMCTTVGLDGNMVEITAIYDQIIEG